MTCSRGRSGLALALGLALAPGEAAPPVRDVYEQSVVALTVTYQSWDEDRPWAKKRPGVRQASAVVVDGPRLLTTAQIVADATFLQADKFGRSTRTNPRVEFVDREIDLALIAVDDPAFFADLVAAPLAARAPSEGTLRTVRWRNQQLESAASRVKRIVVESSTFTSVEHPFLTVETDLDAGGWAEPVFLDGQLVGITVSQNERRARVLPVEILARFLERAKDPASYRPFAVFGALWQLNTDPAVSAWLGQVGEPRGILIRQVPWGSSGCGVLEPWDILLSIDGQPIDAEGFFAHPRYGQLRFPGIFVIDRTAGDVVPIQVLRGGASRDLQMALRAYPAAQELIPARGGPGAPPYRIAGGLVFRELDAEYLRTWGRDWASEAPLRLLGRFNTEQHGQAPERRRIVLLKAVLPSEYTIGYHGLEDLPVETVNGIAVDSIEGLNRALERPVDGFQTIVLAPNGFRREIVLDAAGFEAATAEILEEYGIPAAGRASAPVPFDPGPPCPGHY